MGVKLPDSEADHSYMEPKFLMHGALIPRPPLYLHGAVLRYRDNSTIYIRLVVFNVMLVNTNIFMYVT
jgi:hypothetical protein